MPEPGGASGAYNRVMKPRSVVSAILALASIASAHAQLVGKAPAFSGKGPDGKTYDLATLTKNGPVYLFFIKKDCPVTAGAMHFYTDIAKAYGDKAPILGVFSGDADEYKDYNDEHHLPFPSVLDPKLDIIASYKVRSSPWMVEVKQDGAVGRSWHGYSQSYLKQINDAVSVAAHASAAKIDFSQAPTNPAFG